MAPINIRKVRILRNAPVTHLVFAFACISFGANAGLASAAHMSREESQFTKQTIVDWPL